MPREPTILVIGSHAISVRPFSSSTNLLGLGMVDVMRRLAFESVEQVRWLPGARGAGGELRALGAPLGLLVERLRRDVAQPLDGLAVEADRGRRELPARGLVHE